MKTIELIEQLGRKIGLPRLSLTSEGTCALTVGDGMEIVLEGDRDGTRLHVNGLIGPLPASDGRLLSALLTANHNGEATGGSALAIDPRSSVLCLTREVDTAKTTVDDFAKLLESFARYLAFWIDYLPRMSRSHGGAASPAATADAPGAFIRA